MADWGDGVSASCTVCLLAAPWVQLSVSAGYSRPHNALRHQWLMPISCHFRDCKALLITSLTHVSDAIASVQTFTFDQILWEIYVVLLRSATLEHNLCGVSIHPFICLSHTRNDSKPMTIGSHSFHYQVDQEL